jgi:hypothetical protein
VKNWERNGHAKQHYNLTTTSKKENHKAKKAKTAPKH